MDQNIGLRSVRRRRRKSSVAQFMMPCWPSAHSRREPRLFTLGMWQTSSALGSKSQGACRHRSKWTSSNSGDQDGMLYNSSFLNRSEFVITDTELKLIAAAAKIGRNKSPKNG